MSGNSVKVKGLSETLPIKRIKFMFIFNVLPVPYESENGPFLYSFHHFVLKLYWQHDAKC